MSQSVTVTGMILSASPIGENDKRIVILTKEKGKISAFAKGARRQNSHLLGATNPFSFGEFVLYEGRSSYNLLQANISNYFMELATDLEGAYYGFYFMEFADYYTKEHNDERQMLRLLYQTLRALSSNKIPRELVRYIFELKTLVVNGEYPDVFHCTGCGTREQGVLFSCRNRGIVCEKCRRTVSDGSPALLYLLLSAFCHTLLCMRLPPVFPALQSPDQLITKTFMFLSSVLLLLSLRLNSCDCYYTFDISSTAST